MTHSSIQIPKVSQQIPSTKKPKRSHSIWRQSQNVRSILQQNPSRGNEQVRSSTQTSVNIENRLHKSSAGNPISQEVKSFMEPRMQTNFGNVRIHTDTEANRMNKVLNARAFTRDHDIYFAKNQYKPHSTEGKRLLAHELSHVVQQAGSRTMIQRSGEDDDSTTPRDREQILQELEGLRPADSNVGSRFGSTDYALQTFQARITDLDDFIAVAESYGMQPGNLLAVFVLEGGWGRDIYGTPLNLAPHPPTPVTLHDEASLAAWHLWQTHGMDDYAVTRRVPGRGDNIFDVNSRGHRAAMMDSLGDLFAQGMLWNADGVRPQDPRQQLTPAAIVTQLTQNVNLGTQLPSEGFIRLAYRIQAATVASRQQLIGRSQQELGRLGYSSEVVSGFRHGEIERQRVRVAEEHQLIPASVHTPRDRALWTYRHLSDPEFGQALMEDDQYRALVRRSFELRMPEEAARITMGTPAGARRAIADANTDFQRWHRQRDERAAIHRWALDINVYLIILRGGLTNESRTSDILSEITASLNETNLPNRLVRRAVVRVMREWIRDRNYDNMERLIHFAIDAGDHFSHIESTREWIEGLSVPHGDTTEIPRELVNYLLPTSRAFSGRIRTVLRIYGQAVRFAGGLVEARQELD